uniref:phosphatidate cytidylyltransferase n=1 Tax=Dermatophagoides pteronyssinus TaxID=6956 RepID=A0A6P6XJ91_DERPT|nr:phosphatidate cytidylyltransferase 2-like [Dermatophagoides pteronyssinus]
MLTIYYTVLYFLMATQDITVDGWSIEMLPEEYKNIASVALNDTFAYLVGKKYGKTSLINVSPNKTIEGFLGAAVLTPIFTLLVGEVLQRFKLFTCADLGFSPTIPLFHDVTQDCKVSSRFALQPIKILGLNLFYRHAWFDFIIFGLFASFGAPLGGFLSSAIKRYFKIKDYSNTFPGHGGYSDRFDCQLIMAMFTWLYAERDILCTLKQTETRFTHTTPIITLKCLRSAANSF